MRPKAARIPRLGTEKRRSGVDSGRGKLREMRAGISRSDIALGTAFSVVRVHHPSTKKDSQNVTTKEDQ